MKQIKPNIYLLESGKIVNIYAIVHGKSVLLIDTGTPGKADNILKELAEINIQPPDIKAIVITHAHPDHAGSCTSLIDKTHAKLYIHKYDLDVLLNKAQLPKPRYVAEKLSVFIITRLWKYIPPTEAIPLDYDSAVQGFEDLKVIPTPGHTPGSMSILDTTSSTLFCGDVINNKAGKITGPNKYGTINMEQAWHSVAKIGALSFDTLCPGHGTWIAEGAQKRVQDLLVANKHT
jgi:glyoxylase-like metal-dependent hydrolase (beta-lactamase superfamily II)